MQAIRQTTSIEEDAAVMSNALRRGRRLHARAVRSSFALAGGALRTSLTVALRRLHNRLRPRRLA